jgi:hypothetical protein
LATEIQDGWVVDGHLGGYRPGGDEATLYPDLWTWLVESWGVRSMVDVGCGEGIAVDHFAALGVDALGVEGIPQEHSLIVTHDYTTGPLYFDPKDLVWSCEFVEHVEERYVDNFLATFACGLDVLITHAEPGQAGYHHVNCQPADYWIERMRVIGYDLDPGLTRMTRSLAACNTSPWNHYARSGLAFHRTEARSGRARAADSGRERDAGAGGGCHSRPTRPAGRT